MNGDDLVVSPGAYPRPSPTRNQTTRAPRLSREEGRASAGKKNPPPRSDTPREARAVSEPQWKSPSISKPQTSKPQARTPQASKPQTSTPQLRSICYCYCYCYLIHSELRPDLGFTDLAVDFSDAHLQMPTFISCCAIGDTREQCNAY